MSNFAEWFEERMSNINYHQTGYMDNDECTWIQFKSGSFNDDRMFHVFYAKKPLTEAIIRTTFAMKNEPILFVIDDTLLPNDKNNAPDWIRALHAIYYGRIYTWWRNLRISGVHYDWHNNKTTVSPTPIDGIHFEHVESKLKAFPGNYYVAMFGDRAFWKQEQPKKEPKESWQERAKKYREEWEQTTKNHYERQSHSNPNYSNKSSDYEDLNEEIRAKFNEYMNSNPYEDMKRRTSQRYTPQGDKWFMMLVECGSLVEAKKKYKQLALEYHPDRNTEGLETMQAINAAWDKVREYYTINSQEIRFYW